MHIDDIPSLPPILDGRCAQRSSNDDADSRILSILLHDCHEPRDKFLLVDSIPNRRLPAGNLATAMHVLPAHCSV